MCVFEVKQVCYGVVCGKVGGCELEIDLRFEVQEVEYYVSHVGGYGVHGFVGLCIGVWYRTVCY